MPQHVVENLTVAKQSKDLTEKDLDAAVDAFNELDFRPVVTADTAEKKRGAPAHGRVIALRRVGKKLVATVETAHTSIADALRNGKLTASLYHNLKRGGRKFRRALKSISLHGITEIAIKRKRSGVIASKVEGALVRNYKRDYDSPTAGERLDELIRSRMANSGDTSYSAAMTTVLSEHPELHRDYAATDNLMPSELDARRNRKANGSPDVREERHECANDQVLSQTQLSKPKLKRRLSDLGPAPQDRRVRDRRVGNRRTLKRRHGIRT